MARIGGAFPGTQQERDALLTAVRNACGCRPAAQTEQERPPVCGAHALLLNEALLKALIFYRRWHAALERGEWLQRPAWAELLDLGAAQARPAASDTV